MILVTGGTGFIGRVLIQRLVEAGYQVRTLIRPSLKTPNLPKGVPVEVAVTSLKDRRGLRAAMMGIHTVYHLASVERHGVRANLAENDIQATQAIADTAAAIGVKRLFYLSHLGVDQKSAYAVLKAKAMAEEAIRRSGVDYTIFRSAIVFGQGDMFTTRLAKLARYLPFIFPIPGDGTTLIQPLWVEDLVACLIWALEEEDSRNRIYEIGGGEFISIQQASQIILEKLNLKRAFLHISPPLLHSIVLFLETYLPGFPITANWLDYLAANRTCPMDTLPRIFHLIPARFATHLDYLSTPRKHKVIRQPHEVR